MPKYLDLNKSFKLKNSEANVILTDMKAICQDLERLFNTPKGSVPFNRAYGTSLRYLLFENNLNPADVAIFLYQDITDFEPRVDLNPSDISITRKDLNTYVINCKFTVPSLNNLPGMVTTSLTDMSQEAKDEAFLEADTSTTLENIYNNAQRIYNHEDYERIYR